MIVIPRIIHKYRTVEYATLNEGDTFLYNGDLFIKSTDNGAQDAICLNNCKNNRTDMCDSQVIPVNAEIKWSYKKEYLKSKND